jgi:asparagine synthase (glutamine-hydrolysing)
MLCEIGGSMSAIAGVYNFNKSEVLNEQGINIMSALFKYPFDSLDTWNNSNIYLGCLAQWIMPENIHKKQCFYDDEKKLAITADVILDNRNELFQLLSVHKSFRQEITDCELVLLAYCKWGDDAPKYLIGDFAFMIWDERKNQLFGARDFSGARTLYYCCDLNQFVFCTIMDPLLQLPHVSNSINDQWIAEYLAIPNMIDTQNPFTTVFKDIQSIPPGHSVSVSEGRVTFKRYCKINVGNELKFKSDSDYIEAFQDVFKTAVNSRLRTHKKVGAQLSGGLDSGSVVSVAARTLKAQDKQLYTFSSIPISGFKDWTPKHRVPDERESIKATVNHIGNIYDKYLNFDNQSPYSEIDEWLDIMETPYKFFENSVWVKGIYEAAEIDNVGVLLVGARGNTTISWGSALEYYSELIKKMKYIKLYREINQYSENTGAAKANIFKVVLKKAYPTFFHREKPYEFPKIISKDLEKKTNVFESLNHEGINLGYSKRENIYDIRLKHFDQINVWNTSGTSGTKLSLQYGVQSHDPTNDIRVINFCLSIPIEKFFGDGFDRALIRRATKGYLPDTVRLNQRTRGIQGVDSIQRMSSSWGMFVDEINLLCLDPLAKQYLNVEVLKTAIETLRKNIRGEYSLDPNFRILMRSIIVYRFLKKLKGGEKNEKRVANTKVRST